MLLQVTGQEKLISHTGPNEYDLCEAEKNHNLKGTPRGLQILIQGLYWGS